MDALAAGGSARSTSTQSRATAGPDTTTSSVPAPDAPTPDGSIDVLTASRDAVRAEVADTDTEVRAAQAAADLAHQRVVEAEATALQAAARSRDASTKAAEAAAEVRSYAVEAFVRPPAQDVLSAGELAESSDAAYATGVLTIVAGQRRRVVDTMVAARALADRDREAASAAAGTARTELDRARSQVVALQSARAEQVQLASQLDDRLDAALSEAAALRSVSTRTAEDLATQEIALRSSGPASPPAPASAAPRPTVPPGSPGTSSPQPNRPATTTPPTTGGGTTTTGPPVTTPGLVTWSDVVKVGGIWVNKSVASQVRGLLDAAAAAGISLSGGGYRDPAGQIAVRRANCGTSDYAIYQMPASQCTPPTARPGTSMHERGLAMDLQSSGRLITSRSDPAFVWLAANAARFGFHNLPSEPWHWSTTGT